MTIIHPTAIVEDGAHVGADVEIGPFAIVHAGAYIGDDCRIGPQAIVYGGTTLGARCHIHAGAVLGDTPQDLAFKGGTSFVEIGEECVIREGVTIHRGTKEGTTTVVGPRCYLMANSHVGHNAHLGERVILANGALLAGYVIVEDFAFISGNCAIHQFCRVGRLAMIGGGAILTKDCPPYCTVRSNTLNRVVGMNVIGLRRAGFDSEARREVKRAFALLYLSGVNVSDAREALVREFPSGPAAEFARFLAESKRGICAGPKSAEDAENSE